MLTELSTRKVLNSIINNIISVTPEFGPPGTPPHTFADGRVVLPAPNPLWKPGDDDWHLYMFYCIHEALPNCNACN